MTRCVVCECVRAYMCASAVQRFIDPVHLSTISFLQPVNEVCEGYVFTGVCLSTGGVTAPLHAGIHTLPPDQKQTPPQCMLGYGQQAGGTHPTGMHSCSHFWAKAMVDRIKDPETWRGVQVIWTICYPFLQDWDMPPLVMDPLLIPNTWQ